MTIQEQKRRLRVAVRAVERALNDGYIAQAGAVICRRLTELPEYRAAKTVFCFVGYGREVDTRRFLEQALGDGKRVCVPACIGPGAMELRQIDNLGRLSPGAYGIPEPSGDAPLICADQVDLAVIPCLSCTYSGDRLGKGGGFYDRFLAGYSHAAVLVCPDRLVEDHITMEAHDRAVPMVLTERGLYRSGRAVEPEGKPARSGRHGGGAI